MAEEGLSLSGLRTVPDEDPAALVETLQQTWSDYGIEVDCLEVAKTAIATAAERSPGEMAEPSMTRGASGSAPGAVGRAVPMETLLPPLLEPAEDGVAPIELGDVLGEGGMGVVHAATQTALDRTVAVKMLHPGSVASHSALQLLREGRITGRLEHPNVVPVHTLGRDGAGRPLIVMKRIDGTPWTRTLDDVAIEERMSPAFLRTHLGHLRQVALAVHFAHDQGVLHRDIKPDNVMMGAFGEVYLVDWGVAVRLSDAGPDGVPRARDVRRIEGTPMYMAPEMALGEGDALGAWSDVYLLGATLHHIITGDGPHDGADIRTVLTRAFLSPPPAYEDEVPAELAAIARRAMARGPEDRYESAADFADALDEFILHRGSLELCEEGERRATELETLAASDERVDEELEALFHEARFAFEQALRSWPENRRASDGRRKLLEAMVGYELRRGSPRAALALLRRHDAPPESLVREVEEALERLETMERDANVALGVEHRIRRAQQGAAGWLVFSLTCGALTRYDIYPIDHWRFVAVGSTFLIGSVASFMAWKRSQRLTATNRGVAMISLMVFATSTVLWPLMGAVGVSMPRATVLGSFVNGLLWLTVVLHIGKAWLPLPISHFVVTVLAWFFPAYHFEIYGLTAVGIVATAELMRRDAQEPS